MNSTTSAPRGERGERPDEPHHLHTTGDGDTMSSPSSSLWGWSEPNEPRRIHSTREGGILVNPTTSTPQLGGRWPNSHYNLHTAGRGVNPIAPNVSTPP